MLKEPAYLLSLIPQFLIAFGLFVALIVAVVRRARLGTAATVCAAIGLAILAIVAIVNPLWAWLAPEFLFRNARNTGDVATAFAVMGLISNVLMAIGLGLLIAAVFTRRPGQVSS